MYDFFPLRAVVERYKPKTHLLKLLTFSNAMNVFESVDHSMFQVNLGLQPVISSIMILFIVFLKYTFMSLD